MNDLQEKFLDTRFEMLASERVRDFWLTGFDSCPAPR